MTATAALIYASETLALSPPSQLKPQPVVAGGDGVQNAEGETETARAMLEALAARGAPESIRAWVKSLDTQGLLARYRPSLKTILAAHGLETLPLAGASVDGGLVPAAVDPLAGLMGKMESGLIDENRLMGDGVMYAVRLKQVTGEELQEVDAALRPLMNRPSVFVFRGSRRMLPLEQARRWIRNQTRIGPQEMDHGDLIIKLNEGRDSGGKAGIQIYKLLGAQAHVTEVPAYARAAPSSPYILVDTQWSQTPVRLRPVGADERKAMQDWLKAHEGDAHVFQSERRSSAVDEINLWMYDTMNKRYLPWRGEPDILHNRVIATGLEMGLIDVYQVDAEKETFKKIPPFVFGFRTPRHAYVFAQDDGIVRLERVVNREAIADMIRMFRSRLSRAGSGQDAKMRVFEEQYVQSGKFRVQSWISRAAMGEPLEKLEGAPAARGLADVLKAYTAGRIGLYEIKVAGKEKWRALEIKSELSKIPGVEYLEGIPHVIIHWSDDRDYVVGDGLRYGDAGTQALFEHYFNELRRRIDEHVRIFSPTETVTAGEALDLFIKDPNVLDVRWSPDFVPKEQAIQWIKDGTVVVAPAPDKIVHYVTENFPWYEGRARSRAMVLLYVGQPDSPVWLKEITGMSEIYRITDILKSARGEIVLYSRLEGMKTYLSHLALGGNPKEGEGRPDPKPLAELIQLYDRKKIQVYEARAVRTGQLGRPVSPLPQEAFSIAPYVFVVRGDGVEEKPALGLNDFFLAVDPLLSLKVELWRMSGGQGEEEFFANARSRVEEVLRQAAGRDAAVQYLVFKGLAAIFQGALRPERFEASDSKRVSVFFDTEQLDLSWDPRRSEIDVLKAKGLVRPAGMEWPLSAGTPIVCLALTGSQISRLVDEEDVVLEGPLDEVQVLSDETVRQLFGERHAVEKAYLFPIPERYVEPNGVVSALELIHAAYLYSSTPEGEAAAAGVRLFMKVIQEAVRSDLMEAVPFNEDHIREAVEIITEAA